MPGLVPIIPAVRREPFADPAWRFDLKLARCPMSALPKFGRTMMPRDGAIIFGDLDWQARHAPHRVPEMRTLGPVPARRPDHAIRSRRKAVRTHCGCDRKL